MKEANAEQQRRLRDRGICVVIPTYNNVGTIGRVVEEVLKECGDVIVVNDGSTDGTSTILEGIDGITIVDYAKNRGKGYALKRGFRQAKEMGFAYAITLDGDGQHYASDIAKMLKANQEHPGALIIGSRQMEGMERSKGSVLANDISNFWFYVETGKKLKDTQTGYRLYPLKKLRGMGMLTCRYEAELELLVLASWHGVELVPIEIGVYYPPRGERVSHFRPVRDFLRISVVNTLLCVLSVVYGWPLRLARCLGTVVRTLYSLLFVVFFCLCVITPFVWVYFLFEKRGRRTRGTQEGKRRRLHWLIYHGTRFMMLKHGIPGTTFSYKLSENVDFERPSVVISNHQSHIDLACQLIFTPNIVFLTNDWVWKNPLYGLLIRHAEFYPISEGIEQLLPKLRDLVARGYSIAVYPEGTRSKDCRIGRFHRGAFHIAEQLELDITPMYLYGAGRILRKGTYYLRKGPIYVEVGNRITQEEQRQMGDTRAQAQRMRKHYERKYEAIANMMEKDV
ncbi:MAG: glycosyltransferase [Prevotella sp.]|jgi:1-acyl-sn-glycerol-3-phosphate acyltransferase|nr:glycosyltransferase [Prevotella sp.]